MSRLEELRQAWQSQFPGEELPDVWKEEEVRTALVEHRELLQYHKYETEKEGFLVHYLEEMLAAAQFRNHNSFSLIVNKV